MTNAEKYLKDEVDVEEFIGEFNDFISKQTESQSAYVRLAQFLKYPAKPPLTENEKVILRNIPKEFVKIKRENHTGNIFVEKEKVENEEDWQFLIVYNHLFKFIRGGEEYKISELLGDE